VEQRCCICHFEGLSGGLFSAGQARKINAAIAGAGVLVVLSVKLRLATLGMCDFAEVGYCVLEQNRNSPYDGSDPQCEH